MTSPEKKKAPALGGATGAIKNRKTNLYQEEGITMTPILSRNPRKVEPFNATMTVAIGTDGLAVVQPNDDGTVTIAFNDVAAVVAPAVALSLAAAIQSVAVYALEQASEVAA